ncbi:hypothetical protein BGX26_004901, partial [Mortierella sp. AD094]
MTDLSQSKSHNTVASSSSQQAGASSSGDDTQHTPNTHHHVDDAQRTPVQKPIIAPPFDIYNDPNSDEDDGASTNDPPFSPAGRRRYKDR